MKKRLENLLILISFTTISLNIIHAQCWEQVYYHTDSSAILDIFFLNDSVGIAGGQEHKILRTDTRGDIWYEIGDFDSKFWYAVYLLDQDKVIVSEDIRDIYI